MAGFLRLAQGVTSVPAQGPWLPCSLFKQASADVEGMYSNVTAGVLLADTLGPPLNGYKVTVGGTITVGDVVSITVTSSVAGVQTVGYTVQSGNTLNQIAAALATALAANAALAGAGFLISEGSGIVILQFPSLAPGQTWDGAGLVSGLPESSPPINYTTIATAVSGSGTETATVGLVSNGSSILTLNGTTPHAVLPGLPARWVQGNVTALIGSGATVNVNLAAVA
jgi:hypothetical protein